MISLPRDRHLYLCAQVAEIAEAARELLWGLASQSIDVGDARELLEDAHHAIGEAAATLSRADSQPINPDELFTEGTNG